MAQQSAQQGPSTGIAEAGASRSLQVGPLSITDFVRFAGAVGDFNPIHHDADYARSRGFERPIAMGLFTAAVASRVLTDWCGLAALRSYGVRFAKPVWPDETLTVTATREPGGPDPAPFAVSVANSEGEIKIKGRAAAGAAAATPELGDGPVVRDFRMPIERGKIAEFARAMQDRADLYQSLDAARAAGFPDIPAPPLFLNSSNFHLGDDWYIGAHAGIPLERCIHAENGWQFIRPPVAGDILHGVTRLVGEEKRQSSSGGVLRFVTFETQFRDHAGDLVQVERMVVVEIPEGGT